MGVGKESRSKEQLREREREREKNRVKEIKRQGSTDA